MTEECFDEFWKAYPRKVKKKESKRIWNRDKLDNKIDDILKDLSARPIQDQQWVDGYIPHPSTYLNGELWEDEWESVEVKEWHETSEGITLKGFELGIFEKEFDNFAYFKNAVFKKVNECLN
jgi:hypothetical protein